LNFIRSFGYGLIATVVAALAKYASGIVTLNMLDANVVGCGMIGRGDLGFLLISQAFDEGLVDEKGMGITLWALILCTMVSPFLFKLSLTLREKRRQLSRRGSGDLPAPGPSPRGILRHRAPLEEETMNEETAGLRLREFKPSVNGLNEGDASFAPSPEADAAASVSHDFETCESVPI
jgi:hypothetical protein